jgi:hypothetical protein
LIGKENEVVVDGGYVGTQYFDEVHSVHIEDAPLWWAFMIFFELFFEIFSKEKPDKWIFLPSTVRRKFVHHRRSQVK